MVTATGEDVPRDEVVGGAETAVGEPGPLVRGGGGEGEDGFGEEGPGEGFGFGGPEFGGVGEREGVVGCDIVRRHWREGGGLGDVEEEEEGSNGVKLEVGRRVR